MYRRMRAARRIQRAYRRVRGRRLMGMAGRKGRYIRRTVGMGNPSPTFVETFRGANAAGVGPIPVNQGGVFAVRVSDIPQVAQYNALYKQYRINWIKVILVPDFNSEAADHNTAAYNATVPTQNFGLARIAFAINDSPQTQAPATEAQLLSDNGCKIKSLGSRWSASFKPVPDVAMTSNAGTPIWTRQKYRQWFNFDLVQTGNNPLHYGLSYYITQLVANTQAMPTYNVYYKVSFSLRDPQ